VINGCEIAAGFWFAIGLVKRQIRPAQTDAVNRSI
jgi:hypothetical protein